MYNSIKTLPLKIFFEIAETGNLLLLGDGTQEDLITAWNDIITEYSDRDENRAVKIVIEKSDQIYNYAANFCEIKAMLLYLVGAESEEYTKRLQQLGYKIDLTNHKSKIESIVQCDARAANISTQMNRVQSEIDMMSSGEKTSFDRVMAWLSGQLGFEVKEDITVIRYLEYKKQIIERNKAKNKVA